MNSTFLSASTIFENTEPDQNKITYNSDLDDTESRTKIIATIGPNTDSQASLERFINAGVKTVRLNFSHGTHKQHLEKIKWTRAAEAKLKQPISIMLDTKGPEIRVGKMKNGQQQFTANQTIKIRSDKKSYETLEGDNTFFTVSHDLSCDLTPGFQILVDDGKWTLNVTKIEPGVITAKTLNAYTILSNKRINVPGAKFSMSFLSEQDKADIKFGIENHIDYISASFVSSSVEVEEIKSLIDATETNYRPQIIAKIESVKGIENLNSIVEAADGIMVARGDLGLEIPFYDIPYWEKVIIRHCRTRNKFVIVATQMLESMTSNPHPTRAEVSDVYFAVELGADAVMLSGETANGKFPLYAISAMQIISKRAEKEFYSKTYYKEYFTNELAPAVHSIRDFVARSVTIKARDAQYKFAIVLSNTGKLLKTISKFRPNVSILALTACNTDYHPYGCWHSIFPILVDNVNDFKTNFKKVSQLAIKNGIPVGSKILFVYRESVHILEIQTDKG